jgi:hypothetical protein
MATTRCSAQIDDIKPCSACLVLLSPSVIVRSLYQNQAPVTDSIYKLYCVSYSLCWVQLAVQVWDLPPAVVLLWMWLWLLSQHECCDNSTPAVDRNAALRSAQCHLQSSFNVAFVAS